VYVCMLGRGRTQTSIQDGWVKTRRNAINNEFRKRKVGPFSKFFLQTQSALLTDNLHISSCYVHRRALEPYGVRPGSLISGYIAMDSRMEDDD